MIDYWKLTKDFSPGDAVQQMDYVHGQLSPFVGKVTAVHRGLGMVDVQWPFGNERVYPDDIVKVNPQIMRYLPPSLDQSYSTYDVQKGRQASSKTLWRERELPPALFKDLAMQWAKRANEVTVYDNLYRKYASQSSFEDSVLRSEVARFYRIAARMFDLRLDTVVQKTAAYWVAQNRTYRATSQDIESGKPSCPKCAQSMKKRTYKMHEGAKRHVFACPQCLFLVDPESVLGPTGEPHTW